MSLRQGKRRRMKKFLLNEIAAVDRPAMEPARAVIMKRHDSTVDPGPDPRKPEATMSEDKTKAEERIKELEKKVEALTATETKLAETEKALARAEKLAKLSDAEKAHLSTLDESGQETFLAKSEEDRRADVRKAADADPVVYKDLDGNEYRKSEDPRVVSAIKRADEATQRAQAAETLRKQAEFEKRADEVAGHLPGTVQERAAVVKALEGISDEETRKAAFAALEAGNKAMSAAFVQKGSRAGGVISSDGAEAKLETLAKAYAKEHGVEYLEAYEKVGEANPELLEAAITRSDS